MRTVLSFCLAKAEHWADASDSDSPAAAPSAPSKPSVATKPVVKSKWADEDEDDSNVVVSSPMFMGKDHC